MGEPIRAICDRGGDDESRRAPSAAVLETPVTQALLPGRRAIEAKE
jgi:hypothetical protein